MKRLFFTLFFIFLAAVCYANPFMATVVQQQTCVATETPETSCADSIDNDCDGLVDGADSDCGTPVEITFQDGVDSYAGTIDTYIVQDATTTNYGTSATSHSRAANGGGYIRNILISFDLSSITGPVTVTNATLSILRGGTHDGDSTCSAYRLLRNWVETEATWNVYSTGNSWSTAGAAYNNADRDVDLSAAVILDTIGDLEWKDFSSAQLAADVQDMINNGSNYGWVLFLNTSPVAWHVFVSSEDVTTTNRPKLTITYTVD